MIANTNDGSSKAPALRIDAAWMMLKDFPAYHSGPRGDAQTILAAVKAAGYTGVQGGDPKLVRAAGLRYTTLGRINQPGESLPFAKQALDEGADCATLHVGWGHETEDAAKALLDDVVNASAKTNLPLYIETHRATLFQDLYRTVQLLKVCPDVRINGDFSHFYTGQELRYGDLEEKWNYMQPIFDRVKFMHGRIGNSCSMQVDLGDGTGHLFVDHFRSMWTRAFSAYKKTAQLGDYFIFCPELLSDEYNYARLFRTPSGELREECDRWEQAKVLCRIARECWDAAR
jgi:hypothetical protein